LNNIHRTAFKRYCIILLVLLVGAMISLAVPGCGTPGYDEMSCQEAADYGNYTENAKSMDTVAIQGDDYDEMAAEAPAMERKVIQNARMTIEVSDVGEALDAVIKICEDNDGYTVSSNLSRDDDWARGEVDIKVPAESLSSVMEEIAAQGEMTDKNISTQDVTEEYYDSQARLTVLEKKEERLIALMDQAKTIEEIITVESELTSVRSDIEVLQGRLNYLQNVSSYSSIYVLLRQSVPGTIEVPKGTFGKAGQAFINSINGVVDFLSGFFIWLIGFIPWTILLALIYLALRALKRKFKWGFKRKRKNTLLPQKAAEEISQEETDKKE